MASKTTTSTIGNVVLQAREKYEELMESEYISIGTKIDGVATRCQSENSESIYSTQDKNSKLMTCLLNINVKRGSYIEVQDSEEDMEYIHKGIVTTNPTKTPVDKYFTVLMFNAEVTWQRNSTIYDDNGDIISNNPSLVKNIPCYIERIGLRERQVDVGIDRNSVNKIIAHSKWEIKMGDIIFVGDNRYKITDIEELEKDMFSAYMTFYRE